MREDDFDTEMNPVVNPSMKKYLTRDRDWSVLFRHFLTKHILHVKAQYIYL